MSKDLVNAPAARSWRDIPQPVKPRTMSRGGRWRLALATLRTTAVIALVGALGWAGWMVVQSLQDTPENKTASAAVVPVRKLALKSDGVLDRDVDWLARALALPRRATLMELDLLALRERLMADGQVFSASLTRSFPDELVVQITERTPVARVMAAIGDEQRQLLVARDGVVFPGAGYDDALVQMLPWLDGIKLVREGGRFLPIADVDVASELLGRARLEAEHLYRTWEVVSLARLRSDREIEVKTRAPQSATIVFGATGDFLLQLAKLDYLWDQLEARQVQQARIDLSLGRQVPVSVVALPTTADASPAAPAQTGSFDFSLLSALSSKTQREL